MLYKLGGNHFLLETIWKSISKDYRIMSTKLTKGDVRLNNLREDNRTSFLPGTQVEKVGLHSRYPLVRYKQFLIYLKIIFFL